MSEIAAEASVVKSLENKRARTTASSFVVICGIAVVAASVGAELWLGASYVEVHGALTAIILAMLAVGVAVTVVKPAVIWTLAPRCFWKNPANVSLPELQAEQVKLTPSWRTFVKDPVTGLFTHDALLAFADDAIPYFRRYKRGVSILMVEIDQFHAIKDRYGHEGADQVIRHVAEVLDLSVRKTDKVARFEGNRFVILLREISEEDTLSLAHRIRDAVADLGVRRVDFVSSVRVSIGAAIVADSDFVSETLIERAESALDKAKANGGNRVSFSAISKVLVGVACGANAV